MSSEEYYIRIDKGYVAETTRIADLVKNVKLEQGEYFISINDIVYEPISEKVGQAIHYYYPTQIRAFSTKHNKTRVFIYKGKIGSGGFGAVLKYSTNDSKDPEFLALKITNMQTNYLSETGPNASHHSTESRAPQRLRDFGLSDCASHFIETFVAHSDSLNSFADGVFYGEGGEGPPAYANGSENIVEIWREFQLGLRSSASPEEPPRLTSANNLNFDVNIFTVMRMAKSDLFASIIKKTDLEGVIDFVNKANICLAANGYYYKDLKLDQILVMQDGTYRLGDLGNLCHLTDSCEFGFFDDPNAWIYKFNRRHCEFAWEPAEHRLCWITTEPLSAFAIQRGIKWQNAMFVSELVCAIENTTEDEVEMRYKNIVYQLAPFRWNVTTPTEIFERLETMYRKNSTFMRAYPLSEMFSGLLADANSNLLDYMDEVDMIDMDAVKKAIEECDAKWNSKGTVIDKVKSSSTTNMLVPAENESRSVRGVPTKRSVKGLTAKLTKQGRQHNTRHNHLKYLKKGTKA